jgi:hypothetical protein
MSNTKKLSLVPIYELAGASDGEEEIARSYGLEPSDLPTGGWLSQGAAYETIRRILVESDSPEAESAGHNHHSRHRGSGCPDCDVDGDASDTPHPSLVTVEPGTNGREVTLAFGYVEGRPTGALFVGDSERPILLPQQYLQIAAEQGWG